MEISKNIIMTMGGFNMGISKNIMMIIDIIRTCKVNISWAETWKDKEYAEMAIKYAEETIDSTLDRIQEINREELLPFYAALFLASLGFTVSRKCWISGTMTIKNNIMYHLTDEGNLKEWVPEKDDLCSDDWLLVIENNGRI